MSDKSFVTLEQRVCQVCGCEYDTNALLFDTRMRDRFDRHTVTGWGMCPEHTNMYERGMIALVEVDNDPSLGSRLKQESANRTGKIAHLNSSVWDIAFDTPLPTEDGKMVPAVFVQKGVISTLLGFITEGEEDGDAA